MLKERGLIAAEELSEIVAALDGIELARLGEGEDVHEAIEAELIARVGAIGGGCTPRGLEMTRLRPASGSSSGRSSSASWPR
jgi:hypothetical protein